MPASATLSATSPKTAQAVDWTELRALHVKGVSLKELSDRYGIKYETIRSRSSREKWCNTVATAREAVLQSATEKLAASSTSWIGKVDSFVHKSLDAMLRRDPDELSCKDLSSLMTAAAQCATIARQNYGLDKQTANAGHQTLVQVALHGLKAQTYDAEVVDVPATLPPTESEA